MGKVRDVHQLTHEELARVLYPSDNARLRMAARLDRRPAITGGGWTRAFRREIGAAVLIAAAVVGLVLLGFFNY
jgi:hypothetical protein